MRLEEACDYCASVRASKLLDKPIRAGPEGIISYFIGR